MQQIYASNHMMSRRPFGLRARLRYGGNRSTWLLSHPPDKSTSAYCDRMAWCPESKSMLLIDVTSIRQSGSRKGRVDKHGTPIAIRCQASTSDRPS